jgi:hypothetical protein
MNSAQKKSESNRTRSRLNFDIDTWVGLEADRYWVPGLGRTIFFPLIWFIHVLPGTV